MAIFGEPLTAMVQNLGQTHNSYASAGGTSSQVLSQGFTTGPDSDGYELLGFGVDIDGSGSQFPDGPTSVSVAVHADLGGKPGAKLFDLLSPSEYAAGHSFFEAPSGTALDPGTSYVLVWRHLGGTVHRLAKTSSGSTDRGARAGFAMADAFYQGADLANMAADPNSNVLEIAVYGRNTQNAIGVPRVWFLRRMRGCWLRTFRVSGILTGSPMWAVRSRRASCTSSPIGGSGWTAAPASRPWWAPTRPATAVSRLMSASWSRWRCRSPTAWAPSRPSRACRSARSRECRGCPRRRWFANTAQTASADATITEQYAMGFRLGDHGQGYEISGVSIELAAAPSSLTVSLWAGPPPGHGHGATARTKLFDFEDPASFAVGLNDFAAPPGAFAYQNLDYFVVLSGFGASLSIKETTSDAEDTGGETGATLRDKGTRTGVLRLAVKGSQRQSGILVSTYAQIGGNQEIVSVGDQNGVEFTVGTADRYLIRGVTFSLDDTTSATGASPTRGNCATEAPSCSGWSAHARYSASTNSPPPRARTVTGTDSYELLQDVDSVDRMGGVTLGRHACTPSTSVDSPSASGVTPRRHSGNGFTCDPPLMAIFGEPLAAMVQNLGQTHNSYASAGGTNKVLSQGFTTGPDTDGYELLGIGVDIDGSGSQFPDGPVSVSVAVHADLGGKPAAKLFDLLSPAEFAAGHSFLRRRRERRWILALPMCWCGATSAAPCTGWRRPPAAARTAARGQASPWRTRSIRAPTWPTWPRTPTATCWRSRCTAETPKTPSACRGFWFLRRMRGCWLRTFRVSGILTGSPMWAVRSRRASCTSSPIGGSGWTAAPASRPWWAPTRPATAVSRLMSASWSRWRCRSPTAWAPSRPSPACRSARSRECRGCPRRRWSPTRPRRLRPTRRSPSSTRWGSGWAITARAMRSRACRSSWPRRRRA